MCRAAFFAAPRVSGHVLGRVPEVSLMPCCCRAKFPALCPPCLLGLFFSFTCSVAPTIGWWCAWFAVDAGIAVVAVRQAYAIWHSTSSHSASALRCGLCPNSGMWLSASCAGHSHSGEQPPFTWEDLTNQVREVCKWVTVRLSRGALREALSRKGASALLACAAGDP